MPAGISSLLAANFIATGEPFRPSTVLSVSDASAYCIGIFIGSLLISLPQGTFFLEP
jgi:hypothetical protein